MSMVIRSNLNSINASRNLGINNSQVAKAIEKLASGYAINRAADDASGLAITEKMAAQITGLDQGTDNALEGIGLVQTAEGAMGEIHDMLNRMVELSTKSANGTIQDEIDREAIQAEVSVLVDEIDRIAQSTNYNGIDLLNGNLSDGGLVIKTKTTTETTPQVDTDNSVGDSPNSQTINGITFNYDSFGNVEGINFNGLKGSDLIGGQMIIDGLLVINFVEGTPNFIDMGDGNGYYELDDCDVYYPGGPYEMNIIATDDAIDTVSHFHANIDSNSDGSHECWYCFGPDDYSMVSDGYYISPGAKSIEFILPNNTFNDDYNNNSNGSNGNNNTITSTEVYNGEGLILHVADQNESYNKIEVFIDSMRASALGIENLNVSDQESAGAAIYTIKNAINYVSTNRCNVGALQNRLEHTINGNNSTSENMSASKSRIKDADMAKEMMEYTKMNVLTEAAQAMLAQSNQSTQQVLSLLG